jgi:glycosyltransferase involved in cell wall biosynthesis
MPDRRHIHILTPAHGAGLRRSGAILAAILRQSGFKVTVTIFHSELKARVGRAFRKLGGSMARKPLYDMNIFLETAKPGWFRYARVNCLIPNQEWMRDDTTKYLPEFDSLLCKTRHAEQIFRRRGLRTRFVGFTGIDRFDGTVTHNYDSFVHMAGSSELKGTETLVRCWSRHPEWPMLKVLWHAEGISATPAGNIQWTTSRVDERTLRRLQKSNGVHFCLSAAEGFGHYIVEAMSCQAVVLTTDAPPMNELVQPDLGILVPYGSEWTIGLSKGYRIDDAAIERSVEAFGQMNSEERKSMGENARAWYIENDRQFRQRLVEAVNEIVER